MSTASALLGEQSRDHSAAFDEALDGRAQGPVLEGRDFRRLGKRRDADREGSSPASQMSREMQRRARHHAEILTRRQQQIAQRH